VKVQKIRLPNSEAIAWVVLDNEHRFIEPIKAYLRYLGSVDRSPNTIHAYASHLKLYWEYLESVGIDWGRVNLEKLADFILWLRMPDSRAISLKPQESRRAERTVNAILSVVCGFYDFHERNGTCSELELYRYQFQPGKKYKSFLHHINKGKETRTRLLKLKQPKRIPKTLETKQVEQVINACHRKRDKFLICLLSESGMRIGQALGLRHEDIKSWDNEIQIVSRNDNANGARAKTRETYAIHVSQSLMALYSDYLTDEYPEDIDSDYLFVNIWEGRIGHPMTYSTIQALFTRLSKETGFKVHPHMFRHTHATELIRNGTGMAIVQKRLGHSSIQTTIDTYVHVTDEDMKKEYQQYIHRRSEPSK
jgi:integrase/recombinase XerD